MESKIIKLTLPDPVFQRLKQEKEKFAYSTIQEIINETIRNKFFREQKRGGKKRGRPKKIDESKVLTRSDKIFSKDGVPIEV